MSKPRESRNVSTYMPKELFGKYNAMVKRTRVPSSVYLRASAEMLCRMTYKELQEFIDEYSVEALRGPTEGEGSSEVPTSRPNAEEPKREDTP